MRKIVTGDMFLVALLILETDALIIDNVEVDNKRNAFTVIIPKASYEAADKVFKGYKTNSFQTNARLYADVLRDLTFAIRLMREGKVLTWKEARPKHKKVKDSKHRFRVN